MGLESIKRCKICRAMFQYSGYGPELCPRCKSEDEEKFKMVKSYLRNNPGKTMHQTAIDCEVEEARIRMWLREERLEYANPGDTGLTCEKCGKPITSGTICDECRQGMSKAVAEMARSMERPAIEKPVQARNGDKMRFLGRR